jgi:predicted nucleic acid-binding Zn ribbon protein
MESINKLFEELAYGGNSFFKKLWINMKVNDITPVIGETMAKHCNVKYFKDGVLYIECDDSTWAHEVYFYSEKIKRSINLNIGHDVVKKIKVHRR